MSPQTLRFANAWFQIQQRLVKLWVAVAVARHNFTVGENYNYLI